MPAQCTLTVHKDTLINSIPHHSPDASSVPWSKVFLADQIFDISENADWDDVCDVGVT